MSARPRLAIRLSFALLGAGLFLASLFYAPWQTQDYRSNFTVEWRSLWEPPASLRTAAVLKKDILAIEWLAIAICCGVPWALLAHKPPSAFSP
jgi:hypothetical protein